MRHRPLFAVLIATLLLAAACTQSHTPTSPSRIAAVAESSVAASTLSSWAPLSQRGLVVAWACFTAAEGCPLIPPSFDVGQDAPGAPSNLAFQVSGSTVILTWSAPSGAWPAASYLVEAGTGPGLSNIASFNAGNQATTLTVTDVPAGTYIVRVRARNADGTSGPSNEVTIVVTTGPCPPPGAPGGLVATVSGSTVLLQWNAFTGAITYIIEAGSSSGATNIIVFETGSAATSFSGNAPPGTYFIRIRVRTACGTSSVSNEVIATVSGGGPPPPGGNLSGRWFAHSPANEPLFPVDFEHVGTRLTGTVIGFSFPARFDLTQSGASGNILTFNGTFTVSEPGPCSPAVFSGTMSADTVAQTMNGTFSGRNTDCRQESNTYQLRRQP